MAKIDVTGENFLKIMEIQRVILKDVINAGLDEASLGFSISIEGLCLTSKREIESELKAFNPFFPEIHGSVRLLDP